jgi:hypothetical protein
MGAADIADVQDITDEELTGIGMKLLEIKRLRRQAGM